MQEEILEAFRTPLFFVYISVLLSFCVVNGSQLGDRVELEFQAYRLQQYELAGSIVGSKSFRVLYEAATLDSNALRKSTIATWRELATRDIDALFKTTVGALIVIVPNDFSALSPSDRKQFNDLEKQLSTLSTELAVYAIKSSDSASALLAEMASSTSSQTTAVQQLVQVLSANTFQLSSSSSSLPGPVANFQPKNIIARLSSGIHSSPTIAFIAHYDTHAAFPDLAIGADSNGSGVVALLELLAILKKFYERPSTRPPYNIVFAWTTAGKYNYQGTKVFVEDLLEKNGDARLELAICLDSIGRRPLNVHVSKLPTAGSASDRIIKNLRFSAPNESIEVIAKKININLPFAWEHERLNARRLPAVTLSQHTAADAVARRSLLDTSLDLELLSANIRNIAEAVLSLALNLPRREVPDERVTADRSILSPSAVSKERVAFFAGQFASSPRPLSDAAATERVAARLAALAAAYAPVRQQKVQLESPVSPIAPEKIVAEKVKAAVFDLLLAGVVAVYLSLLVRFSLSAHSILEYTLIKIRKTF